MNLHNYITYVEVYTIWDKRIEISSLTELKESDVLLKDVNLINIFKCSKSIFEIGTYRTTELNVNITSPDFAAIKRLLSIDVEVYPSKTFYHIDNGMSREIFESKTSLYETLVYFNNIREFITNNLF